MRMTLHLKKSYWCIRRELQFNVEWATSSDSSETRRTVMMPSGGNPSSSKFAESCAADQISHPL